MKILKFEKLGSTQDKVIELIDKNMYIEKTFVVAENQVKGRGRSKTTWIASCGCITFSYALKEDQSVLKILSFIKKALLELGAETAIKWPNDITLKGKKVGGVIVDEYKGFSVVGVGINLLGSFQYPTIESLIGKKLCKEAFLQTYASRCEDETITEVTISSLWFGSELCKVKKVHDRYLVLEDKHGKDVLINADQYSYLEHLNRVVKKPALDS